MYGNAGATMDELAMPTRPMTEIVSVADHLRPLGQFVGLSESFAPSQVTYNILDVSEVHPMSGFSTPFSCHSARLDTTFDSSLQADRMQARHSLSFHHTMCVRMV